MKKEFEYLFKELEKINQKIDEFMEKEEVDLRRIIKYLIIKNNLLQRFLENIFLNLKKG